VVNMMNKTLGLAIVNEMNYDLTCSEINKKLIFQVMCRKKLGVV